MLPRLEAQGLNGSLAAPGISQSQALQDLVSVLVEYSIYSPTDSMESLLSTIRALRERTGSSAGILGR